MALKKTNAFRSRKLLDLAKGRACVECGLQDETVVGAHYSGLFAAEFGKGRGIKPHDWLVAWLCWSCHEAFDSYKGGNGTERSAFFFRAVCRTLAILFEEGHIK